MADIEDLMLAVIDSPKPEKLEALKSAVAAKADEETAGHLETLWEEWESRKLSPAEAKYVLAIAALGVPGKPYFRKMLVNAVKTLLPPFIAQAPVVKAVGVRDEAKTPAEIAGRFEKLLALRSGSIVFLEGSRRWGVAGTVDAMNASLPMMPFAQVGSNAAVPLEIALKDAAILASGPDVSRLVVAGAVPVSAALFRLTVEKRKLVPIPEERLKLMARSGCARKLDDAAFERYWNIGAAQAAPASPAAGAAKPGSRRACDGRSLKEIQLLLTQEQEKNAPAFAADEVSALCGFFERLSPVIAQRDSKLVAEVLAMVFERTPENSLQAIVNSLVGKIAFFPEKPAAATQETFSVWGELASKLLEKLCAGASKIFPEEYLAACAVKLPLKAINCIGPHISNEVLCSALANQRNCGADLLLWIWKNRKKRKDDNLLALVNLDNVSRALSNEDLPKVYLAARRELLAMLVEDKPFQAHIIAMLDDDPVMLGSILQGALFLDAGQRQSLMVKLAQQSKKIQEYLEGGAGKKILDAGTAHNESNDAPVFEATYTSVHSHQMLIKELDDIINIHVPENREALKTARAHGDFRENSEFDAAKERRNYLSRRRGELERELANIQPVLMANVEVTDVAVIGSQVEIELSDGRVENYCLLGAWDGNPERRFLSYRTRLGKALLNRKTGEEFEGPDGKPGKLLKVSALPAELIAELDK
ncbi:MAG: GreA/GreB family elongation factor [Lentisphaeria bacterium]|nr:GreA/GreB family elongation factor [Lentisphaeria bacterium]